MLPDKSRYSLKDGLWLVHNDGINTIRIFGSNTGKERIYLNEEVVVEDRNIGLKSEHHFKDNGENAYELIAESTSLIKGKSTFALRRNGELIRTFNTEYQKGNNSFFIRLVIVIACSVVFSFIKLQFGLPEYTFYIFLVLVLFVYFVTRDNGQIKITES